MITLLIGFSLLGLLTLDQYRNGHVERAIKLVKAMIGLVVVILFYIAICSLA